MQVVQEEIFIFLKFMEFFDSFDEMKSIQNKLLKYRLQFERDADSLDRTLDFNLKYEADNTIEKPADVDMDIDEKFDVKTIFNQIYDNQDVDEYTIYFIANQFPDQFVNSLKIYLESILTDKETQIMNIQNIEKQVFKNVAMIEKIPYDKIKKLNLMLTQNDNPIPSHRTNKSETSKKNENQNENTGNKLETNSVKSNRSANVPKPIENIQQQSHRSNTNKPADNIQQQSHRSNASNASKQSNSKDNLIQLGQIYSRLILNTIRPQNQTSPQYFESVVAQTDFLPQMMDDDYLEEVMKDKMNDERPNMNPLLTSSTFVEQTQNDRQKPMLQFKRGCSLWGTNMDLILPEEKMKTLQSATQVRSKRVVVDMEVKSEMGGEKGSQVGSRRDSKRSNLSNGSRTMN